MKVKYNRVSTIGQSGDRFETDTDKYDLVLLDKVSGTISFRDRPKGAQIVTLVNEKKVTDLVVEEFSRLGRNTGDVINVLDWLDANGINVIVKNIGLQSRPNGVKNPIWKMISSVMSSLYEMELANIRERTTVGRFVYLQKGGRLGRKQGTTESINDFLNKSTSLQIRKSLGKGLTIREISKVVGVSSRTVMKVKKLIEQ
ncbi:Site-specific DNA recombinase [Mucilaginibacter gossypiicola]|uniref:Site-specific DNA recombinase n=1 Tax=Mucilaginibacter gossypiicola TaxID=551995 RepID=A0A1H8UZV6_9SPHI|nr:recombinase family protein [Mucilaginibacter gossypiicola]SEP08679.1 Site-specific DNA recombinase [Mucilaginibacter gossypiicola]